MLYAFELNKKFHKEIENKKYEMLDGIETFNHDAKEDNLMFINKLMDLVLKNVDYQSEQENWLSKNTKIAEKADKKIRAKIEKYLDSNILPNINVNTVHPGVIVKSSLYRDYCDTSNVIPLIFDSFLSKIFWKTCKQGAGTVAYALLSEKNPKFVCDCVDYPLPQPSVFPNAKLQTRLWKETLRWLDKRHTYDATPAK